MEDGKRFYELFLKMRDIQPEDTRSLDDRGFSQIYSELFSRELRYNATSKNWMFFDGSRWVEDAGGRVAALRARETADLLVFYGSKIENEDKRSAFCKCALRYGALKYREILVRDAAPLMQVTQADFDKRTNLLNLQNCTLDLNTFKVHDHRPEDMLSKICACAYDPEADGRKWNSFIWEIMQNDVEKIRYLQRISGLFLTSDISLEAAFFLYGATTRNGKSTFLGTLGKMLGNYADSIQPETLAQTKNRNGSNASPDIAKLDGIRLLSMSEPPKRMLLDVSLFKQLTGGDMITARHLYQRPFSFQPQFKLVVNCNELPVVTDNTVFSSDRVRIITFDRHFSEQERNPHLKQDLQKPETLSSVLNWCLDGLRSFRKIGEMPPECVLKATNKYEAASDKIAWFIDDRLVESDKNTSGADVYVVYKEWCNDAGYTAEGKASFFDSLRRRNMLAGSGTVNGKTVRNVVRGYEIA